MRVYIGSTFSPLMLAQMGECQIWEVSFEEMKEILQEIDPKDIYSIVGHENTANILSKIFGISIEFNRETVQLEDYFQMYIAIPINRDIITREFSSEEIYSSDWRFFNIVGVIGEDYEYEDDF